MKLTEQEPVAPAPAAPLDEALELSPLSLAALALTGFYFCLSGERVSDPINQGEPHQSCSHCHSTKLQWNPPI